MFTNKMGQSNLFHYEWNSNINNSMYNIASLHTVHLHWTTATVEHLLFTFVCLLFSSTALVVHSQQEQFTVPFAHIPPLLMHNCIVNHSPAECRNTNTHLYCVLICWLPKTDTLNPPYTLEHSSLHMHWMDNQDQIAVLRRLLDKIPSYTVVPMNEMAY